MKGTGVSRPSSGQKDFDALPCAIILQDTCAAPNAFDFFKFGEELFYVTSPKRQNNIAYPFLG